MKVKIVNKSSNDIPSYARKGDAGMDIRADFTNGIKEKFMFGSAWDDKREKLLIFSGGRALIPTGVYTAIPEGFEIQVRPRSGLALKQGVTVLNTPGTIDSGYRNEYGIIIMNLSDDVFEISQGDRIAQLVLSKVEKCKWIVVDDLNETERGKTGFGDSGVK